MPLAQGWGWGIARPGKYCSRIFEKFKLFRSIWQTLKCCKVIFFLMLWFNKNWMHKMKQNLPRHLHLVSLRLDIYIGHFGRDSGGLEATSRDGPSRRHSIDTWSNRGASITGPPMSSALILLSHSTRLGPAGEDTPTYEKTYRVSAIPRSFACL